MRETIQNANGKQFHAVSLSGGKDSTAMLLLMIERDMLIDMVLVLVIGALLWKPLRKYITGEDLHGAANAKNEG